MPPILLVIMLVSWAIFIFERLPILEAANKVRFTMQRSLRVMREPKFSDHWKEAFMAGNSIRSLRESLLLSLWILLFVGLVAGPVYFWDWFFPESDLPAYLVSWQGILVSFLPVIAFLVYRYLKKR